MDNSKAVGWKVKEVKYKHRDVRVSTPRTPSKKFPIPQSKNWVYHGRRTWGGYYQGRGGFSKRRIDSRLSTSPVIPSKSLYNKYSVLCIEETDNVEDDDKHKKRVETTSKPISPTWRNIVEGSAHESGRPWQKTNIGKGSAHKSSIPR